ncbi:porphobilinogen deaminase [Legionella beliardensis]|uniref:Porphobilinogen deaminase n=1 Tax=Legionella beliardensis TaxID=91822 RepID=A0A378I4F3_9GAMM|nr:hydroxymethylbilane synthase [Legionella beliardensis]STX29883.1 porphobilinogen deaminase [Legionella beliardensis]
MTKRLLRIATRKSPLALWQANFIGNLIKSYYPDITIELLPMITSGDKFNKDKLQALGGKGLFVKELEEALLEKRADLAVHSMKDVPAELPNGLELVAICRRENPFDVFISRTGCALTALPTGSIIGTASLRRQSQLLAFRSDLIIKSLRGNVNTRLGKLHQGEYDGIILAAAGLIRMDMNHVITEVLDDSLMLPACGQGALGIETRADDQELKTILIPLNDSLTATCVHTERYVNALLGGNCHVPLAVFCTKKKENTLLLRANVLTVDGKTNIYEEKEGPISTALNLAKQVVDNLLAKGAGELLATS